MQRDNAQLGLIQPPFSIAISSVEEIARIALATRYILFVKSRLLLIVALFVKSLRETATRLICEIAHTACFSSHLRSQSEATVSCKRWNLWHCFRMWGYGVCVPPKPNKIEKFRFENLQVANIMKMTIVSWDIIIIINALPSTSSKSSWSKWWRCFK